MVLTVLLGTFVDIYCTAQIICDCTVCLEIGDMPFPGKVLQLVFYFPGDAGPEIPPVVAPQGPLFADDVQDVGLLEKLSQLTSHMKIMMSERARGTGLRARDGNHEDSDLITDWAEGLEDHRRRGSWGNRMRNMRRFRYLQGQRRKQLQVCAKA